MERLFHGLCGITLCNQDGARRSPKPAVFLFLSSPVVQAHERFHTENIWG
jgi:hypothetical protein